MRQWKELLQVASLLVLGGCIIYTGEPSSGQGSAASRPQRSGEPSRAAGPEQASAPAGGALAAEARRIDVWLVRRGFTRVEPSPGAASDPTGRRQTVPLLSGLCYVGLALGDEGAGDVELTVADAGGVELARDVRVDRRAIVRLCPVASGAYQVEARAPDASRALVAAVYRAPQGETAPLDALLQLEESRPAETSGEPPPPGVDHVAWGRITAAERSLQVEGWRRSGPPAIATLAEGGRARRPVQLLSSSCYVVLVATSEQALDADAVIFDPSGVSVASDAGGDRDARVELCPAVPGRHEVEVRLVRGNGQLVAVMLEGQARREEGERASTPASSLGASYAALDRDILGRGYGGLGAATAAELAEGQQASHDLALEGGRCYAVAAVGEESVTDLDLRLVGPGGQEEDVDMTEGRTPLVRVCPDEAGTHRVEVLMRFGHGRYMYRAYAFQRGARGAFGLTGILYLRAMELVATLGAEGYEPVAPPERAERQRLDQGASRTHGVRLEAGRCYAIGAAGGEGLHDLDLELSSAAGGILAAEVGPNSLPVVRYCPERSGQHRLRVTARGGSGRYVYQVFARQAEDSSAE